MNITFILPWPTQQPIGGYLIIYEYADRLAGKGHQVTILHSLHLPYVNLIKSKQRLEQKAKKPFSPNWFDFKNKVNLQVIPEISNQYVPDGNAIFATFWPTTYSINKLKSTKGRRYYFIQGYDIIWYYKKLLHNSYKLGFQNIVVSKWLEEKLILIGAPVFAYVPNGIDFKTFHLTNPIEKRSSLSIAMILKEPSVGLEAINLVKKDFSKLTVTVFGVNPRPKKIPDWINYIQRPLHNELSKIYNDHAIFISSSNREGFGLPGAEAMACGCALVTTDSGGVREYAIHEQTALVSPIKNPVMLANNIKRLINNNNLRIELAQKGNLFIQNYSWEKSINKIEEILCFFGKLL